MLRASSVGPQRTPNLQAPHHPNDPDKDDDRAKQSENRHDNVANDASRLDGHFLVATEIRAARSQGTRLRGGTFWGKILGIAIVSSVGGSDYRFLEIAFCG